MVTVRRERRKYRRTDMGLRLQVFRIIDVDFQNVNISPSGIRFRTAEELSEGEHVLLFMRNHTLEGSPISMGIVVRVEGPDDDGKREVAAKFVHLDPRSRGVIIEWTRRGFPARTSVVLSIRDGYLHELLVFQLPNYRYDVFGNFGFGEALEKTVEKDPSVVVAEVDGTDEELEALAGAARESCVIVIARNPGMDLLAKAATHGIFEVVEKPVRMSSFLSSLGRAVRASRGGVVVGGDPLLNLDGRSKVMEQVTEKILEIVGGKGHILVMGETGTGKGRVVEIIHRLSDHGDIPPEEATFVRVNLAQINPNLIESELFGHEKGAFTGADKQHIGCFERAGGGTIFLDEVSSLTPYLQQKLLGVLDVGEFTRMGGKEPVKLKARVLAASNKDLVAETSAGNFREDLMYRLCQNVVYLPPLRERREDLLILTRDLLDENTKPGDTVVRKLDSRVVEKILGHDWPGNVRELRDAIIRSKKYRKGDTLYDLELVTPFKRGETGPPQAKRGPGEYSLPPVRTMKLEDYLKGVDDQAQKDYLVECLKGTEGNVREAAKLAGIGRQAFYKKMKYHGITREDCEK